MHCAACCDSAGKEPFFASGRQTNFMLAVFSSDDVGHDAVDLTIADRPVIDLLHTPKDAFGSV